MKKTNKKLACKKIDKSIENLLHIAKKRTNLPLIIETLYRQILEALIKFLCFVKIDCLFLNQDISKSS